MSKERDRLVGTPRSQAYTAAAEDGVGTRPQDATLERRPGNAYAINGTGGSDGEDEGGPGAASEVGKSLIFGALDGALTSFAIVAGAVGGGLGGGTVLVLGLSSIVANGLSLGLGEYLSSKAHNEYIEQERRTEEWQLQHNREAGVHNLIDSYIKRGMSPSDADFVVRHFAKYESVLVDFLVSEELGMPNYRPLDELDSCRDGLFMFLAFAVAGVLPLLAYALALVLASDASPGQTFAASAATTGVVLFAAGGAKSAFSARSWFCAGVETLVLGGACAGIAYEVAGGVAAWAEAEGLL